MPIKITYYFHENNHVALDRIRLTKISAIAQSYRQSSAWPIRLDLLAATHDRGQLQRHHMVGNLTVAQLVQHQSDFHFT